MLEYNLEWLAVLLQSSAASSAYTMSLQANETPRRLPYMCHCTQKWIRLLVDDKIVH